jgi:lipopolysaccharide export system protein LptC
VKTTAQPPELHLPDLPEVSVRLGRSAGRPRRRWRDLISAYLPILIMTLLALATWWLVKSTPGPAAPVREAVQRHDPDYTMENFTLTRFDRLGQFKARIVGRQMRHYPDRDQVEIDEVQIHALASDGRVTDATAQRALTNGDASELELIGAAHVRNEVDASDAIVVDGEWLHLFLKQERLRSTRPVVVRRSGSEVRAAGVEYDHLEQKLRFAGPLTMVLNGNPAAAASGNGK